MLVALNKNLKIECYRNLRGIVACINKPAEEGYGKDDFHFHPVADN